MLHFDFQPFVIPHHSIVNSKVSEVTKIRSGNESQHATAQGSVAAFRVSSQSCIIVYFRV